MLGVSSSLIASSNTSITAGAAGDGAAISAAPSQLAPPPQEAPESGGSSEGGGGGGDLSIGGEDGERNSGGNRWPRQETLALLKIRSEMDVVFKDSSLKGPLWEEVSRKLAELGYHRSAKKCKEKFENVYKYHRRTKDGRASKADGKTYRFFDQLQALENNPSSHSNIPPPPLAATPITMAMPMRSGNNSANPPMPTPTPTPQNHNHFFSVSQKSVVTGAAQPAVMTAPALPLSQVPIGNNNLNQMHRPQGNTTTTKTSFLSNSTSSSSSTSSDEDIQRRQMKKRKWKEFFESLMKDVIEKQEELQKKFLETLEKRERDRLMREEAWRVQEMARLNREHDLLVQERSMAAAKDATIIAFLQKITEQQNTQTPNSTNNTSPSPFPIAQIQLKLSEKPFSTPPQPQPQPSATAVSLPMTIHTPTPAPPQTLTLPVVSSKSLEPPKSDNGGENFSPASSSRWPKEEIEALISLRTCLDLKYQENGPKGPLWEEISSGMRKIGYNRNAKRCKEKWENINKYFKKVKESNKKRPEDSKTCPYFHQLEALYKEKAKLEPVPHNTTFGLTPQVCSNKLTHSLSLFLISFANMVSSSAPKEVPSDEKWAEDGPPREAKWWYSTFHTVTAMVGAGVLSLPYAMAYLGWGPGTVVMILSWCITLNTMWQMIQLHECVPGVRFDRYKDLGKHVFGPKLGAWIVLPQQLIVQVGCDIVYMVTGGKCLKKFMEIACTNCTRIRQSYWICIFGAIHFFLSQLPNFNAVSGVSLAAAIMSLSYSTIAWVGCVGKGRVPNMSYAYKTTSSVDYMFRVFNALGQVSFAYAGHAVVLEIQATIPSTPEKPSKVPMWKGAVWAYFVNALCYFPVAFIGYWAFGQDVDDNVLVGLERPSWLIAAANLMVVVHVIGSYQVYAMPVFDLMEQKLVKTWNFPPGVLLRFIVRTTYVAFTLFLGVTFPFFGDLLGFFGGFGFAPTSYFLPSIMWLKVKKPRRFSTSWWINWACIFIGVFIMIASTVGGLRNIVADSSSYEFYS